MVEMELMMLVIGELHKKINRLHQQPFIRMYKVNMKFS